VAGLPDAEPGAGQEDGDPGAAGGIARVRVRVRVCVCAHVHVLAKVCVCGVLLYLISGSQACEEFEILEANCRSDVGVGVRMGMGMDLVGC